MRQKEASTRTTWLSSAHLVWAGCLLAALLVLLSSAFAVVQRQDTVEQEIRRTQLLARLLADETTRTLDAAGLTLAMISQRMQSREASSSDLPERLVESVRGLPYMRSLSLLDASGKVLASSNPALVGAAIDVHLLGQPVTAGEAWLGPWIPGRDLTDPTRTQAATPAPPATAPVAARQVGRGPCQELASLCPQRGARRSGCEARPALPRH